MLNLSYSIQRAGGGQGYAYLLSVLAIFWLCLSAAWTLIKFVIMHIYLYLCLLSILDLESFLSSAKSPASPQYRIINFHSVGDGNMCKELWTGVSWGDCYPWLHGWYEDACAGISSQSWIPRWNIFMFCISWIKALWQFLKLVLLQVISFYILLECVLFAFLLNWCLEHSKKLFQLGENLETLRGV